MAVQVPAASVLLRRNERFRIVQMKESSRGVIPAIDGAAQVIWGGTLRFHPLRTRKTCRGWPNRRAFRIPTLVTEDYTLAGQVGRYGLLAPQ